MFSAQLISIISIGQNTAADSLIKNLSYTKQDTARLALLVDISETLESGEIFRYAHAAIRLADSMLNVPKYKPVHNFIYKEKAEALYSLAYIYAQTGQSEKAVDYYFQSIKSDEKINNKEGIAYSQSSLGVLYLSQGEDDKALEYFVSSLKLREETDDKEGITISLHNIGHIHRKKKRYKEALEYLNKSIEIDKQISNMEGLGDTYNSVGVVYQQMGQYDKALYYFNKGLQLAKEMNFNKTVCNSYENMAALYLEINKLKEAQKFGESDLKTAKTLGYPDLIYGAADVLKKVYNKTNDYKRAFEMSELSVKMRDSIVNEKSKNATLKKQFEYEFEKREAATKAERERKEMEHKASVKQQRLIIFTIIIVLFLVAVFSFFMYRRYKITQKQKNIIELQKQKVDQVNEELNQQNEEIAAQRDEIEKQKHFIEEKQREIIDSIHYAKRIQRALLTSNHYIKKYLKNYFILYKPKDIVSGDFYWVLNKDNCLYIAVADCTGHGVPGAFMSMIGINLLNEIILERNISNPALALDIMREEIIRNLNQEGSEEESKDGMDMVLCKFNFNESTLEFSAANNSLYLIREKEVFEYKADKMPVGKYGDKAESFNKQMIRFQEGDMVYLFTDGYADQFGGPKGKKFKYKKLETLLAEISNLPAEQQKEKLGHEFLTWKGDLEQVDDTLIIGIRL